MKSILALCGIAAVSLGLSATAAAATEVRPLPAVAHIDETVVVVHHHHRGHYVYHHHHRVWVRY